MNSKNSQRFVVTCLGLFCLLILNNQSSNAIRKANKYAATTDDAIIHLPSKVKIIDLTQTVSVLTPSYEDNTEAFKYQVLSSLEKDGYGSGAFYMHEHFGTHIDAPAHFCNGGLAVDRLELSHLILPLTIIDVRKEVEQDSDYRLTIDKIKTLEKRALISNQSAVLLLTGWDRRYLVKGQYRNADEKGIMHFPGFSEEAVKYLIDRHKILALGIDTLSADYGPSKDFPVHTLALQKNLFMIENLTNLDKLPMHGAVGIFAPLKLKNGTGSPTRVFALLPKTNQ